MRLIFEYGALLIQLGVVLALTLFMLGKAFRAAPGKRLFPLFLAIAIGFIGIVGILGLRQQNSRFQWEQEVLLNDGSSLWVKRTTMFAHYGEVTQISHQKPHADGFEFVHPKSGERIVWTANENVRPLLLDFEQGVPYLATDINAGKHYDMGCPPHPYAFFMYANGQWQRIGIKAFPLQFQRSNMVRYLDSELRKEVERAGAKMDTKAVQKEIHSLGAIPEIQLIDRRIVNPLYYCKADTDWVRSSDGKVKTVIPLDVFYGEGTMKRLRELSAGQNSVKFISEDEAVALGIIKKGNDK